MAIYQKGEWTIRYDDRTGAISALSRKGVETLSQRVGAFQIAIDGVSSANNQQQMHNIELYDTVGADSRLLGARAASEALMLQIDLGAGFSLEAAYVPKEDWVESRLTLRYEGDAPHKLRWLDWTIDMLDKEGLAACEPFAPGYTLVRGEPYDLHRRFADYRHDDLLSHGLFGDHTPYYRPGFLGAYRPDISACACAWCVNEYLPCYTPVWTHGESLHRLARVHCARWMRKGDAQEIGTLYYGAFVGTRDQCVEKATASFAPYGWATDRDELTLRKLRLMEVHVGDKGGRLNFESHDALIARLPEIAELGFNAIELMPHFPFPSYSVFDLADAETTYGSADGVRRLIEEAHKLGLRVIMDMVFHGPSDYDPKVTRLPHSYYLDEHPDWFMRHDSGVYARTYTRSFDMGNPDYQRHIGDCMLMFLREYHADGFRLDAQMWSESPNWDDKCPRLPYESVLAGMRMMDDIAARIHKEFPEAVFYTEANGPASAKSHEYRYNYDMHWMFPGLAPVIDPRGAPVHTLNLASMNSLSWPDAAMWLHELQLTSPRGMAIVYQTDSHDSSEWGGFPGAQYSREAYGVGAHRVLYGMVNFLGGGLMCYYGAQYGSEDYYKTLGKLALDDVMLEGKADLVGARANDPKTITILRRAGDKARLYVGNLENTPKQVRIQLPFPCAKAEEKLAGGAQNIEKDALPLTLDAYGIGIFDLT